MIGSKNQRSESDAKKEVLVVGGSLSGLTFALACARHGIRTQVLERIDGQHRGGAALGIDRDLLMRVLGLDVHKSDKITPFPVVTRNRRAACWYAVWRWLRGQVRLRSEITLVEGVTVLKAVQTATVATAITADGRRFNAAAIVGADGHRSVVRGAIDPAGPCAPYAGYLLWRGLVNEADLPPEIPWLRNDDGVCLINAAGYRFIGYPVAGRDGSLRPGERQISFAWYDKTRDALLQEQHCLSPTRHVLGSLTRENISRQLRDELREVAQRIWPEPWRTIVVYALEHGDVFATPVAEYYPKRLHRGRLAILGDAAHVVSPMTGKGFVAGILDAAALAGCLKQVIDRPEIDIPLALKDYEQKRLSAAQALVETSTKLSRAFLHEAGTRRG